MTGIQPADVLASVDRLLAETVGARSEAPPLRAIDS